MIIQKTSQGKVLCFAVYADHASMQRSDIAESVVKTLIPELPALPGFEVCGGERKFIVTEHLDGGLEVWVGPLLFAGFYFHKNILEAIDRGLARAPKSWSIQGRQGRISGGGEIRFLKRGNDPLVVEFHGESGDFGPYNPKLILYRDDLTRVFSAAAGVPIKFKFAWEAITKDEEVKS